uniref:FLYWCH-type domain-containing protein n=1 Tax=Panagrolaimus davidi TaxID=227884 RepID=A0A914PIH1_9BILA
MDQIEIEIVKRSEGNPFLFVNQYKFYYCYSYKTNTNIHWQCKNFKKLKCKGTAITNSIESNAILISGIPKHKRTCIPNLQSNVPMPTAPTSMPYYSDPIAATTTTSVSTAATPSVSSFIDSEDPNMLK